MVDYKVILRARFFYTNLKILNEFKLKKNKDNLEFWIVYFEVVDDYKEIYNFVAIDTLKQKKYVMEDLGLKIFRQPELFIKNACWSKDL